MKEKQIYFSLEPDEYSENKSSLLNARADVLHMMKHVEGLKAIKIEKEKLKTQLNEIFADILARIKDFEESVPHVSVFKKEKAGEMKASISLDSESEKSSSMIDEELQEIQEKLARLNS